METGRPTKYMKKYAKEMLERFKERSGVYYLEKIKREKNSTGKFGSSQEKEIYLFPCNFPTFSRYSLDIGVLNQTLIEWKNCKYNTTDEQQNPKNKAGTHKYPEFTESYALCKQIQMDLISVNGLNGLYNSNFAGLMMRNLFPEDFVDRKEIDLGGQKNNPIITKKVDDMTDSELDDQLGSVILSSK